MKKVLAVLGIVLLSLSSKAEERNYTAKGFSYRVESSSSFSRWEACNLPIKIDFDRKRLVIESKEIQIFDWVSLEENRASDADATFYSSLATDTNYRTVVVQFWYQSTQMVIRILYKDVQYQYSIPKSSIN